MARQIGKPCVAGCAELTVDYATKTATSVNSGITFKEGDWISLDGSAACVMLGKVKTRPPELGDGLIELGQDQCVVWLDDDHQDAPNEAADAWAARESWVRPLVDDSDRLVIRGGRHPVVEAALGAARRRALRRAAIMTTGWGFAICATLGLAFLVGGGALIDVMTTSDDVRAAARG